MDLNNLPATRRDEPTSNVSHFHKTGLRPLVIGAKWMIVGTDGKKRQFEAHSRADVLAEARREGREIKFDVVELKSNRHYPTVEALRAASPDEVTMRLTGASLCWAYFSTDNADPEAVEKIASLDREIAGRKEEIATLETSLKKITGKAFDEAILRRDEVRAKLEENGKKRVLLTENIVGLMSDQLHERDLPPAPPVSPHDPLPPMAA